jgi:hypothetical protein
MNYLSLEEIQYLAKMVEQFQALDRFVNDVDSPLSCNIFDRVFEVLDSNGEVVGIIQIVDSGEFGFVPTGDNK